MKIEFGNYIIKGDGICVSVLERRIIKNGPNAGKEDQREIGHYPDLDHALQRVLSEKITAADMKTVKDLAFRIKSARRQVTQAATRVYCRGVMK